MNFTKLIVGNWKMNGLSATLQEAKALAEGLATLNTAHVHVVICPPATLLSQAANCLKGTNVAVGGQDCHTNASGAHTGDISALMLADAGARYVIVGHSERRTDHLETSQTVALKAGAAIQAGLMPIICVGESETQRDAGQAESVVVDQLLGSIPSNCDAAQICIAYEPVWAIGTGRTPRLDEVAAMHSAIRAVLVTRFGQNEGQTEGQTVAILYGGSVNAKNAADLLQVADVNGALVGGACLTAVSFLAIIATQL